MYTIVNIFSFKQNNQICSEKTYFSAFWKNRFFRADSYINSEEEKKVLINEIVIKKPDIIFVAMGSPKQELLIQEMQKYHPAIYQGLGGSFDIYTGNAARAPEWWIKNNLEWAYRLIKQPSRINRQIYLIKFLWLLTRKQI